jgi:hypothetical protein
MCETLTDMPYDFRGQQLELKPADKLGFGLGFEFR